MAIKIFATLLLVFIGSSVSEGEECTQAQFALAAASVLQCVHGHAVNIQQIGEIDVEETCRTVPAMIEKCLDEKMKKPLKDCENEEIKKLLHKFEEAQTGPVRFLCHNNGEFLKELKENDGQKCNNDLMETFQKNCQPKQPSSKEMDCQAGLESLNCLKRSFPDTCKENVKRIIYTSIKQNTMLMGCREYLTENDKNDLEIKLSSAVMTKTNLGLLIIILLALVLF